MKQTKQTSKQIDNKEQSESKEQDNKEVVIPFEWEKPPERHASGDLPSIRYCGEYELVVSGYSLREAYTIFQELRKEFK